MKISKSKRQLAQLLIEAGVTQFPEGAKWSAQDRDKDVDFFENKPKRTGRCWMGAYDLDDRVSLPTLIHNWHQTVLSREEFDQIVAETAVSSEQDADGWIEWSGGECPVGDDVVVDVKTRDGGIEFDVAYFWNWSHDQFSCISERQIIAYRLHNPEQAEPVWSGVDMSKDGDGTATMTVEPTLDQLLQDWRNADDYAQRKQTEADEAAAMRDERWQAVQARAGEMGVTVGRCEPGVELAITGWRDLRIGDCIWVGDSLCHSNCPEGEYDIACIDHGDEDQPVGVVWNDKVTWPQIHDRGWRFIRRP